MRIYAITLIAKTIGAIGHIGSFSAGVQLLTEHPGLLKIRHRC